jgi:CubicO group peptidase (beta-lactamase class C family)
MNMKHNISQRSVSFSILFVIILLLTAGVSAKEQKCIDVSGTWEGTSEIDNSDCGFPNQTISYTYELIQDGCVATIKGEEYKVEVRGNRIYWPPRSIPGRPAGFTVNLEEGVSQVSGNKATGQRLWTRTDDIQSCSGTIVWTDVRLPPKDTEPASTHRERLTANELFGDKYKGDGPVQNSYFMPSKNAVPALHEFSGTLDIASTPMTYHYIWVRGRENLGPFPALKTNFFTYQEHLVPIERNKLLKSKKCAWNIILSPGRTWSEPGDKGYSRASFPFTLIHSKSIYSQTHNGIATFLFNDKHVSALRLQIVQEAAPQEKFDAWGQAQMEYLPSPLPDQIMLTQQFVSELAHQTPIRSWTELEQTYDPKALDVIDDTGNRENITLSGLIIDDAVYARACRTRYGEYPYCSQMRHGIYSASKSLGAMLAMLRLAQKYGDGVFDLKIKDYVEIASNHNGWNDVTFGDTLNMATGIGNTEPRRVSGYVEEDSSALAGRIYAAQTTTEKLKLIAAFENYPWGPGEVFRYRKLIAAFENYPWGPGEVFRYRTTDTFVLAVAMDRFIKRNEGPSADLWNLISREVFEPIGIARMPVLRAKEPNHAPGIPKLEGGMLPNLDEVAKLVKLLRNSGRHQGQKLDEAIGKARPSGLPTGWRIDDGETYYHMSLWLHPFVAQNGCRLRIPAMSGGGGISICRRAL